MQCLLGSRDHDAGVDLGDNHVDLELGEQVDVGLDAAVGAGLALLDAATHDVGDGHAGDANLGQGVLQLHELGLVADDGDAGHVAGVLDLSRLDAGDVDALAGSGGHGRNDGQEVGVSAGQAMLADVEALDFLSLADAQAHGLLDDNKGDTSGDDGPSEDGHNAEELDAEQVQAAAVEEAGQVGIASGAGAEEADEHGAEATADAMDAGSTDGVVDVELLVDELAAEHNSEAADKADDDGADGVDVSAASGDAHQARQGGVERVGHVGLAVLDPGEDHSGEDGAHAGERGGREDLGDLGDRAAGSAVEAVPAEPQDEDAQGAQRDAVAGDGVGAAVLVILAKARAEESSAEQGDGAADHVDDARASPIDEAKVGKPAAAPHPVGLDGVDERADDDGHHEVGAELGALGHGARHDGRGRGAEHELEEEVAPVEAREVTAEPAEVELADEEVTGTRKQAVTNEQEHDCADGKVERVLHYDVARVLRPGETSFDHGETRLHEEHQQGTYDEPQAKYVLHVSLLTILLFCPIR